MNKSVVSLSPRLLTNIFPFYLAISSDGKLVHVGNSIQRIYSDLEPGRLFGDYFEIQSPKTSINFESIQPYLQSLFVLQTRNASLSLKGQMMYVEENDILLFLGFPQVSDLTTLANLGLTLDDFAIHDSITDYLALRQDQETALLNVQKLTCQLEQQRTYIQKVVDREKELNDLRKRLITTASHGFRTPLGIIASSTGILQDYGHQVSHPMREKHLKRIQSAVRRITELLDDVLTISYIETATLQTTLRPFNLAEVCEEALKDLSGQALCPIVFNSASDLTDRLVILDKDLLKKILVNLLSNAVKYASSLEAINLNVQWQDEQIIFVVQDAGIGIPAEDLPFIFDPFHRAKNVGNITGVGLGLAIAKQCVDLLQGQIRVISDVGVGTTVTVTIPVEGFTNPPEVNLKQESAIY